MIFTNVFAKLLAFVTEFATFTVCSHCVKTPRNNFPRANVELIVNCK